MFCSYARKWRLHPINWQPKNHQSKTGKNENTKQFHPTKYIQQGITVRQKLPFPSTVTFRDKNAVRFPHTDTTCNFAYKAVSVRKRMAIATL